MNTIEILADSYLDISAGCYRRKSKTRYHKKCYNGGNGGTKNVSISKSVSVNRNELLSRNNTFVNLSVNTNTAAVLNSTATQAVVQGNFA